MNERNSVIIPPISIVFLSAYWDLLYLLMMIKIFSVSPHAFSSFNSKMFTLMLPFVNAILLSIPLFFWWYRGKLMIFIYWCFSGNSAELFFSFFSVDTLWAFYVIISFEQNNPLLLLHFMYLWVFTAFDSIFNTKLILAILFWTVGKG